MVTIETQIFSLQQDGMVTTQHEVVTMVTIANRKGLDSIWTPQRHTSVAKIEVSI